MADKGLLEKHLDAEHATEREAFSFAAMAAYIRQNQALERNARRQEAQVDAMLKIKYDQCGYPDAYKPPEDDSEMSPTLINCHFVGDDAVTKISQAMTAIDTDGGTTLPVEKKARWWSKVPLLGTLAAVALGSVITFAAAKYFAGDDTDTKYQITALPYVPPQGGDAP